MKEKQVPGNWNSLKVKNRSGILECESVEGEENQRQMVKDERLAGTGI